MLIDCVYVVPQVDYVNYIRDYDENFAHPTVGSSQIVSSWRELYSVAQATPPECWVNGQFLPDGHTVCSS